MQPAVLDTRGDAPRVPAGPERLNRYLARRGVASRRAADSLISSGRVTVNGAPGQLSTVVEPAEDRVCVDGRAVSRAVERLTLMLNKPRGVVSTTRDPRGRVTVMELVEPIPALVPIGRLDADSRGLMMLTTDGELAHRVAHPRFGVIKRYRAVVRGEVTRERLQRIVSGVSLDDGPAHAVEARRLGSSQTLELAMGEGRRREVRRLCEAVGLEVIDLLRITVGPLRLGALPEGRWRPLLAAEDAAVRQAVGLPANPQQ